jgi:anthranilate phosphoribosyltransferase
MSEIVRAALAAVIEGRTLSIEEAHAAMGSVMDGEATPAQLAALLVALRMRGETTDELTGFAVAMRERVIRVDAPLGTIDLVGTGGDGSGTFNISTAAALVVAAAGVPVAKHGNRAVTSRSGSADVLDALGIRIDHDAVSAAAALRRDGFAFLFAPGFHPAMRHAGPTRREIGIRTSFNLLGPLTNPAGATRQVLGVGDPAVGPRLAEVARRLGTERTLVVYGAGLDELPLDGSGLILDVTPDGIDRHAIDRAELATLGLGEAPDAALAGGSPEENGTLVEAVLEGAPGPRRDVALLNAAAAFVAAARSPDLSDGVRLAADTIDGGRAVDLLGRLRAERVRAEAAAAEPAGAAPGATAPGASA